MRWLVLLFLIFSGSFLKAQYGETIRSGRPGQAIGGFTVGINLFQVQSGVTFGKEEFDNSDRDNTELGTIKSKGFSSGHLGFRFISGMVRAQVPLLAFKTGYG